MEGKYVCVDLDGTIAHYKEWQGEDHFGDPVPGVQPALAELRRRGWKVIVFTTRGSRDRVEQYLRSHQIPYDDINRNEEQPANAAGAKVFAHVYVDDRAIQFNGDWRATVAEILSFKAWEGRSGQAATRRPEPQSASFLARDFDQCFAQMRHYDQLMWDVSKFSFVELIAAVGAAGAISAYAPESGDAGIGRLWPLGAVTLLAISYLYGLVAVFMLARLRVYYVTVARYINEQRGFFLQDNALGFKNESGMYTTLLNPRPFDPFSTHLVSLYAIASVGSLLLGTACSLTALYLGSKAWLIGVVGASGYLLSTVALISSAMAYLMRKGKGGDIDVFGARRA